MDVAIQTQVIEIRRYNINAMSGTSTTLYLLQGDLGEHKFQLGTPLVLYLSQR
jgi:hypothetical protein